MSLWIYIGHSGHMVYMIYKAQLMMHDQVHDETWVCMYALQVCSDSTWSRGGITKESYVLFISYRSTVTGRAVYIPLFLCPGIWAEWCSSDILLHEPPHATDDVITYHAADVTHHVSAKIHCRGMNSYSLKTGAKSELYYTLEVVGIISLYPNSLWPTFSSICRRLLARLWMNNRLICYINTMNTDCVG